MPLPVPDNASPELEAVIKKINPILDDPNLKRHPPMDIDVGNVHVTWNGLGDLHITSGGRLNYDLAELLRKHYQIVPFVQTTVMLGFTPPRQKKRLFRRNR